MKQKKLQIVSMANPSRVRDLQAIKKLGVPRTQKDWQVSYIRDPGKTDDFCDFWVQAVVFSPVATAVNRRIRDFIGGKGFVRKSLDSKMVNENETLLDLHQKIVQDFALWGRFAVRVIPMRSGKSYSLQHINAEWVRYNWEEEEDEGYIENIRSCWVLPFINSSEDKQLGAQLLPIWNGKDDLRKEVQIRRSQKGRAWKFDDEDEFRPYKGHIFFYNPAHPSNRVYSRPDLYSAEKDILADGRISEALERITANHFMIGGALTVFGDPNERIKDEDGNDTFETVGDRFEKNMVDHFSGSQNAGAWMIFWAENPEEIPKLQSYESGNLHEMLESSDARIRARIAMAGQIPEVLLGVQQAGSLGQNNELITAIGFANASTKQKRQKLEQIYGMLLQGVKGINSANIEIQEIQNFGDIPQYVFEAMTVTQKEDYMERVFNIDPDPEGRQMPNEIIQVEEGSPETIEENDNSQSNNNTGD